MQFLVVSHQRCTCPTKGRFHLYGDACQINIFNHVKQICKYKVVRLPKFTANYTTWKSKLGIRHSKTLF